MANCSYLACSREPVTLPSFRTIGFDPAVSVLAAAPYSVPLLWMSLFRQSNLVKSRIKLEDGEYLNDVSPVAPIARAKQQLQDAVPVLNQLFANHARFERYCEAFVRVFDHAPGEFVSLELYEIAMMQRPGEMDRGFSRGLEIFALSHDEAIRFPSAPLEQRIIATEIYASLRGKRAIEFLSARTKQKRLVVERVLASCGGNVAQALEFFRWQSRESKRSEPVDDQPAWAILADLASLRLQRRFPDAAEGVAGRFDHIDDEWNWTHIFGSSYLRPLPWETITP